MSTPKRWRETRMPRRPSNWALSYKSDSVDYLLEHNKELSCSLVLFYSQAETQEQIMRILAFKLMEVFCIKNEKKLKDQVQSLSISDKQTMDNAIPIILEDVSDLGLSGVGFV